MPRYIEPVFRPPSEARSLIFQVTVGCSQNSCTFCGMYKGKRFHLRPAGEVRAEIAGIPERYRQQVERVFLADGDALVYPFEGLLEILDGLSAAFPRLTRVGSYASPNSLTTKSPEQLTLLREKRCASSTSGWNRATTRPCCRSGKGSRPTRWLCRPSRHARRGSSCR